MKITRFGKITVYPKGLQREAFVNKLISVYI